MLEHVESLEQLKWVEHGLRIRVVESKIEDREFGGFSIDTPEVLVCAEQMLRERGLAQAVEWPQRKDKDERGNPEHA